MIRPFGGVTPQIPASAYVDLSAQVIGDVHIGEESSVWCNAVLRGDIRIDRQNVKLYFPITSMILISLVLTLILNLLRRFF